MSGLALLAFSTTRPAMLHVVRSRTYHTGPGNPRYSARYECGNSCASVTITRPAKDTTPAQLAADLGLRICKKCFSSGADRVA